jgi:Ca2+/Na+ antiporter
MKKVPNKRSQPSRSVPAPVRSLGMPASVTAITFVALGTSLPDTFASKTAAVQERYASHN